MKYRFYFLTFLFFSISISYTQNKRIDSLKNLYSKAKDTLLIETLNELSWEFKNINTDSALFYAKKALSVSKKINYKKAIASAYNSIGSTYEAKSNLDSALYYHKKSLDIKTALKDSIGIANSYNNIGILEDTSGNYLKALQNYFKALSIYELKAKDPQKVPMVLVNIGIVYKKQKKYNKVLEYYKRALNIYEKINYDIGIVITNGNIGAVFLKTGGYKQAILYAQKARKLYKKLGYNRYVPYMDVNIAEAKFEQKKYNEASKLYKNCVNAFTKDNNLFELCNAKIGLAKSYLKLNKNSEAISLLEQTIEISAKNNYKEYSMKASEILAEAYFISKNYKKAFENLEIFQTKKDSLFEKEKVKDINEILIKYESSKKEKENAQQKEKILAQQLKIKNRNIYGILLTSILLILSIVFFAVYKKNQFKKQQLQKEIDLKDALAKIKTQNRLQEQRLRISRDLHDNIGSQLTFIISSLDNLKYISKDANQKLKDKLTNISNFTGDTIHQLRDTIWAMNKSEISTEDLHSRILSFVEKAKIATQNTNFSVDYSIDKNESFSSIMGMNVFRVVQEAINNAIKYAEASEIAIHLSKKQETYSISILDNGIGFNLKTVSLGNGLSNMEKRMSEIGGTVKINSVENSGTQIYIYFQKKRNT